MSLSGPSTSPDQGHHLPPESAHGFLGRQVPLANLQTPNCLLTDAHNTNLAGGAAWSTRPFPGARTCRLQSAAGPRGPPRNGMVEFPYTATKRMQGKGHWKVNFSFQRAFWEIQKAWGGSEFGNEQDAVSPSISTSTWLS